jgi:hypothetical protein
MTGASAAWPLLALRVLGGEAWAFWWGCAVWRRARSNKERNLADWGYGYLLAGFLRGGLLLALSALGIRWRLWILVAAESTIFLAARPWRPAGKASPREGHAPLPAVEWALIGVISLAALSVTFQTLCEPLRAYDFLAIWGLKARTMFLEGGLTHTLLTAPALDFSHREYPLGWPLKLAGASLFAGEWDEQALGILPLANFLACLLLVLGTVRRLTGNRSCALFSAAFSATLAPLWTSAFSGMADAPLAAAIFASVSLLDEHLNGMGEAAAAGCLVAIPGWTKTEGLIAVAYVIAAALWKRRERLDREVGLFCLLAAVPAVLWALRVQLSGLRLHRDLASGLPDDLLARAGETLRFLATRVVWPSLPLLMAGLILVVPAFWRKRFPREAVFYAIWAAAVSGAIAMSRLPLTFHLPSALPRLLSLPLPLLGVPMAETLAPKKKKGPAVAGP